MGKAVIILLLLAGCASPQAGFCSIAKPHRHSDATIMIMNETEINQELTHNRQGEELCGWKP